MSESAIPGMLELGPGVAAPEGALRFQASRSSGPGGQNVNKLNTRIELWLDLSQVRGLEERVQQRLILLAGKRLTASGELHLASDSHRSQQANRQQVLQRLRELIVRAQRLPRPRKKTRPSAASRRRRLEQKKQRGQVKSLRGPVQPGG
jgi:ribosome-associated protein